MAENVRCYKCKASKPVEEFSTNRSKPRGIADYCKLCVSKHRQQNKAAIAAQRRLYLEANKERIAATKRKYYLANKHKWNTPRKVEENVSQ